MKTMFPSLAGLALGLLVAGACGSDAETPAEDTGGGSCEHGTFSPCVCTDGSMGMQMCAHDTSGFEPCVCDGGTTSAMTMPGTAEGGGTSTGSVDPTTGPGPDDTTAGTTAADSSGGGSTGPVGSPPTAQINHPGEGEDRQVDVPIPFIGVGNDAEDGALSGASLVWSSDVEGMIGEGEMFDAPLTVLGMQVITLQVTDSDGNVAEDSVTLNIIP